MDWSDAVAERIQKEADKLSKYFDRITHCRVTVKAPHHHHHGERFHISIDLGVPGKELSVTHHPTAKPESEKPRHKSEEMEAPHKDAYVAIRDAFRAMRRQLQEYVHCLRHEVKAHFPTPLSAAPAEEFPTMTQQ